jgi:hypothetical protein
MITEEHHKEYEKIKLLTNNTPCCTATFWKTSFFPLSQEQYCML